MNRKQIALAACIAALGAPAFAQSSVTLYGNVDIAISRTSNGSGTSLPDGAGAALTDANRVSMDSGVGPGSRVGFRGREDLGAGLAAVFTAEMGFAADAGNLQQGGLAFGRQIFVGFTGSNWSLTAGRQYSPLDIAYGTNEGQFGLYWGNAVGASGHGLYAGLGSLPGSGTFNSTARVDNSLLGSVTFGPVTARLMLGAGNENPPQNTGRLINPHLGYVSGPLNVQASYLRVRAPSALLAAGAPNAWMNEKLLNAGYDFGAFKLMGGIYTFEGPPVASRSAVATPGATGASPFAFGWDDMRSVYLGAQVPFGANKLSVSVSRQKYDYALGADGSSTTIGVLGEHFLSKRTSLYASAGKVKNDARSRTPLISTITSVVPNGFNSDPTAVSLGVRHQF